MRHLPTRPIGLVCRIHSVPTLSRGGVSNSCLPGTLRGHSHHGRLDHRLPSSEACPTGAVLDRSSKNLETLAAYRSPEYQRPFGVQAASPLRSSPSARCGTSEAGWQDCVNGAHRVRVGSGADSVKPVAPRLSGASKGSRVQVLGRPDARGVSTHRASGTTHAASASRPRGNARSSAAACPGRGRAPPSRPRSRFRFS